MKILLILKQVLHILKVAPIFFAYFKTPIIYFGTPHHPFLSHPHLPLKWGKMIF